MGCSHLASVTMLRIASLTLLLLGVSISGLPQQVGPAVGTDETGNCGYACKQDGSCEVSWAGPPRAGGTSASCFSPKFGGSCFGTVQGCVDCNVFCGGGSGSDSRPSSSDSDNCLGYDERCREVEGIKECKQVCVAAVGTPLEFEDNSRPSSSASASDSNCIGYEERCETRIQSGVPQQECKQVCVKAPVVGIPLEFEDNSRPSSGGGQSDRNCDYQCEANGGCRVKYVGPSRPGQLSGSCFPQSFGGSCSGTPPECRDCIDVLNC